MGPVYRADDTSFDLAACADEPACLMLVGRVDARPALDDHLRKRFLVRRARVESCVYAGTTAVVRPTELFSIPRHSQGPGRVLVVDVSKDDQNVRRQI